MFNPQRLAELIYGWPLMYKTTHESVLRSSLLELNAACDENLRRVRANAQGLVDEYSKLEDRKNQFVDQNLKLRAALNESQEQVKNLTIALHTAEQRLASHHSAVLACEAGQADG